MAIENVSDNKGIKRLLFEKNVNFSSEQQNEILSIFDSIDSVEQDDQKGTLTTFEAMGEFISSVGASQILREIYEEILSLMGFKIMNSETEQCKEVASQMFGTPEEQEIPEEVLKIISGLNYDSSVEMNIEADILKYTEFNDKKYSSQKGVKIGDEWFDFDFLGRVERVYAEEPNGLEDDDANSYLAFAYGGDGKQMCIAKRLNKGAKNPDGSTTDAYYDSRGNITMLIENKGEDFQFKNPYIHQIMYRLDNNSLTAEDLSHLLCDIEELSCADKFKDIADNEEQCGLYKLMAQYNKTHSDTFLEALSKKEPNGQELVDTVKSYVMSDEQNNADVVYKYLDDILADMDSHPDDYKKITIDLMRMMSRGIIFAKDSDGNDIKYDNILNSNGQVDEKVEQGNIGDCWLLAALLNITDPERNPNGMEYIHSLIGYKDLNTENPKVTVDLPGVGRTYTFPISEVIASNHLANGNEDDVRIIEIALDKYRRDMAYEGVFKEDRYVVDIDGGNASDLTQVLFGSDTDKYTAQNVDIDSFNQKNRLNTFAYADLGVFTGFSNQGTVFAFNSKGEQIPISSQHAYNIVKSDDEYVYFTGPENTDPMDIANKRYTESDSTILKLPIEKFLALENLKVEGKNIPKYSQKNQS